MDVLVERYQRRKYVNQEDAPMLYYIRQKAGNVRVMDVDTMAAAISPAILAEGISPFSWYIPATMVAVLPTGSLRT